MGDGPALAALKISERPFLLWVPSVLNAGQACASSPLSGSNKTDSHVSFECLPAQVLCQGDYLAWLGCKRIKRLGRCQQAKRNDTSEGQCWYSAQPLCCQF